MLFVTYITTSTTQGSLVSLAVVLVPSRNASPQQTAAHIRTTFLSPFEPITAMVLFLGTVSRQIILLYAVQSYPAFYWIMSCVKLSPRKPF